MRLLASTLAVVTCLAASIPAHADGVTFIVTEDATGTYGNQSFTNTPLTLTLSYTLRLLRSKRFFFLPNPQHLYPEHSRNRHFSNGSRHQLCPRRGRDIRGRRCRRLRTSFRPHHSRLSTFGRAPDTDNRLHRPRTQLCARLSHPVPAILLHRKFRQSSNLCHLFRWYLDTGDDRQLCRHPRALDVSSSNYRTPRDRRHSPAQVPPQLKSEPDNKSPASRRAFCANPLAYRLEAHFQPSAHRHYHSLKRSHDPLRAPQILRRVRPHHTQHARPGSQSSTHA